jgi:hypothetical protein
VTGAELEVWIAEHQHDEAVAAVDWDGYRMCPTCRRATGVPCVALNGTIAGGQPDGVVSELEHAHAARRRRSGR